MAHVVRLKTAMLVCLGALMLAIGGVQNFLRSRQGQAECIVDKDAKWGELTLRVPAAQNDFYFLLDDGVHRAGWIQVDKRHEYEAVVLIPRPKAMSIRYEGPFRIPLSPYVKAPKYLNIIADDEGIAEGYSCLLWRRLFLESELEECTQLVWFTKNANMAAFWRQRFKDDNEKVTVVAYANQGHTETPPEDVTTAMVEYSKLLVRSESCYGKLFRSHRAYWHSLTLLPLLYPMTWSPPATSQLTYESDRRTA